MDVIILMAFLNGGYVVDGVFWGDEAMTRCKAVAMTYETPVQCVTAPSEYRAELQRDPAAMTTSLRPKARPENFGE